jgi:hypothetical protein
LGFSLARTRSYAINARATCGIEDIWDEDVEHYQGIDEANRHEHVNGMWRTQAPGQG